MLLHISATNFSHLDLHRATVVDDDDDDDDDDDEEAAKSLISAIHGTLCLEFRRLIFVTSNGSLKRTRQVGTRGGNSSKEMCYAVNPCDSFLWPYYKSYHYRH